MNKLIAIIIGAGLVALQGCAGADYEESVESSDSALSSTCYTSYGVHSTKAGLAVAMARELGRWEPLKDLDRSSGKVKLRAGVTCIRDNCANTKSLLGQMDITIDQKVFSNTNYQNDLYAAWDRQTNLIDDLTRNHPTWLPPAHKLTPVGSMTMTGACGPHYIFQVDNLNGTPLTSTQAGLMSNTLCYFGQPTSGQDCGNNPFVGFTKTQVNCPAGRVCVAIDPMPDDNSTTTTAAAGTAPTYPMNRVYNPDNSLLGAQCTTTTNVLTTLKSKCAALPTTCGTLYCTQ